MQAVNKNQLLQLARLRPLSVIERVTQHQSKQVSSMSRHVQKPIWNYMHTHDQTKTRIFQLQFLNLSRAGRIWPSPSESATVGSRDQIPGHQLSIPEKLADGWLLMTTLNLGVKFYTLPTYIHCRFVTLTQKKAQLLLTNIDKSM